MFQSYVRSVLVLASVAVACSSPAPTETGAPQGSEAASTNGGANNGKTSGTTADAGPATTPGKGTADAGPAQPGGGTGDTCKASSNGDEDACYNCCAGSNGEAYKAADDAYAACACAANACAAQCGTFCGSKNFDDVDAACGTCLKGQSACDTQADAACAADATCTGVDACLNTCLGDTGKGGNTK